jgi:hypothetical protein
MELETILDEISRRKTQDATRLAPLADYARRQSELHGLSGVMGGTGGELRIAGMARSKDWDVAYDFAGKRRLLVSLKSIWKNASGTVPNRIDDLMGEAANVQQMSPEIVTGYILLFDEQCDSLRREDGKTWSVFFEEAVRRIAIRKAPLWNQGLLEGSWFIRFDSARELGRRLTDPDRVTSEGELFFRSLLRELRLREPAIPFAKQIL